MSVNKIILIGRLGIDPELRYTGDGSSVSNFFLATNEKWTSGGEQREKTEWHKVVCWNSLAENCHKYLSKGREVYIEGRLQTRSFEDSEGIKRYMTEVVAFKIEFLGSNSSSSSSSSSNAA